MHQLWKCDTNGIGKSGANCKEKRIEAAYLRTSESLLKLEMVDTRIPIPARRPGGNSTSASTPSTSTAAGPAHNQTVVVQNPMTVDESGKLVSNVVVGVTT
ncbi:UNVERIFIED_CONTAM: protein LSD1 [Sesamum radiatum]|uniref:Protein LSD1 n=1 Tax=Sesamum radiatum TaxID=300843 RepID=A0AAW2LSS0_SESRA